MNKREQLDKFLNPKSIAIIGASGNPERFSNSIIEKLGKFKGEKIYINQSEHSIGRKKTLKKINEYKKEIDLAIISLPTNEILKTIKQCTKKEIKNFILLSSGYSGKKDYKILKKIWKIKKRKNLNIIGPKSFGIFNKKINLDATLSEKTPKKGTLAFISQSGTLWSYLSDLDIGFSYYIGLGNSLGLNFSDFIEYLNKDKSTKKIICYIEQLKESKKFVDACKKSNKKIIVVKGGKTGKGTKTTNNSLDTPTNYNKYEGIFKQANVKIANSLAQALDIKKQDIKKNLKKNVAIITNSGGASTLLTDELENKNIKIDKIINLSKHGNPLDYRKALDKVSKHEGNIIVVFTNQKVSDPEAIAYLVCTHPSREKIKAIFLGNSMKKYGKLFKKNKVPFFTRAL